MRFLRRLGWCTDFRGQRGPRPRGAQLHHLQRARSDRGSGTRIGGAELRRLDVYDTKLKHMRTDLNQIIFAPRAGLTVETRRGTVSPNDARAICCTHIAQRSEEHTSELQSRGHLVCRLLLEKKKQ